MYAGPLESIIIHFVSLLMETNIYNTTRKFCHISKLVTQITHQGRKPLVASEALAAWEWLNISVEDHKSQ